MPAQMCDGSLDRVRPLKAKVAVPGHHRNPSNRVRLYTGAVNIQLLVSEPVCPGAAAAVDELRSDHIAVEVGESAAVGYEVGFRPAGELRRRHRVGWIDPRSTGSNPRRAGGLLAGRRVPGLANFRIQAAVVIPLAVLHTALGDIHGLPLLVGFALAPPGRSAMALGYRSLCRAPA
jgi:hypothetical protein